MNSYLKKKEKPELHELVKLYQLHRHSKTCRKYKNETCRFKFGKFFSKETLVAEPLLESMPEEVKVLVLSKRKEILLKVKDYINEFLNPSKTKFFDPSRDDSTEIKSISEVLKELNISEEEYESALKSRMTMAFSFTYDVPSIHAVSVITFI